MFRVAIAQPLCLLLVVCLQCPGTRAAAHSDDVKARCGVAADPVSCARDLIADREWQAIVDLYPPSSRYPAEVDFCRGMALARLGRWQESKKAFEAGKAKAPSDKRFYLELAGVDFKQGDLPQSRSMLRRALRFDPTDSYANDFLATLYILRGNLEAALKYWNRAGKPVIGSVKPDPDLRVDPVLLDRSFVFSPASRLDLEDLRSTKARLDLMDVFSGYRFELAPRQDGDFDLLFNSVERDSLGGSLPSKLLSQFREIPYQTIHLDTFDIRGSASNLESFYRWDAQKRRAFASFSSPLEGDPGWRWRGWLDGRDENWDVPRTISSAGSSQFKLRKLELGAGIASVIGGRWEWKSEVSLSERRFIRSSGSAFLPAGLLAEGLTLKYAAEVKRRLLDIPDRRFKLQTSASIQPASNMTGSHNPYMKLAWGLDWDWLPETRRGDYRFSGRLRSGGTLGQPPVDELFSLGIERDNDLYMRGHPGTTRGMKGVGPLGRSFILINCDLDKVVRDGGAWRISLGPFLDSGRAYDRSGYFGTEGWQWDSGIQAKIVMLHSLTVVLSYGWDLRSGRNEFYSGTSGSK